MGHRPATSGPIGVLKPVRKWDAGASGTHECAVSTTYRLHEMRLPLAVTSKQRGITWRH